MTSLPEQEVSHVLAGTWTRFLAEPAAAHGATIAWYAIAAAASDLTCAAIRDRWHRYARSLRQLNEHVSARDFNRQG
jgi:hypothetical protein